MGALQADHARKRFTQATKKEFIKRAQPVKKMTVKEIQDVLGFKVEIVEWEIMNFGQKIPKKNFLETINIYV